MRTSFVFGRIPLSADAGQTCCKSLGARSHVSFPLKGFLILITDKNRADLDWSSGSFNLCYRNRLTAERRLTIHSYHPGPYASAEVFYESPFAKWAATRFYAGCLLPFSRHIELDPYYQHENSTGTRPNQQKNAAGLILWLYFPRNEK